MRTAARCWRISSASATRRGIWASWRRPMARGCRSPAGCVRKGERILPRRSRRDGCGRTRRDSGDSPRRSCSRSGVSLVLLVPGSRRQPASTPATPAPAQAANRPSVEAVVSEVDQAQKQMETAISHMEQIAHANSQALDPTTAATLDKNLGIIDQAIAETRAAVKSEPASVTARGALFEALQAEGRAAPGHDCPHQRDAQGRHGGRRADRRRTQEV